MVADGRVRRLPTSNKLEDRLRRSEGIGHVLERVEEDLRKNHECISLNISDSHLNHEQDDEEEDEGGVEVGDVEGGAKPPDQCVPSDHHGQQHGGQLRTQVGHQAGKRYLFEASFCIRMANCFTRKNMCRQRKEYFKAPQGSHSSDPIFGFGGDHLFNY